MVFSGQCRRWNLPVGQCLVGKRSVSQLAECANTGREPYGDNFAVCIASPGRLGNAPRKTALHLLRIDSLILRVMPPGGWGDLGQPGEGRFGSGQRLADRIIHRAAGRPGLSGDRSLEAWTSFTTGFNGGWITPFGECIYRLCGLYEPAE